MKRLLLSLLLIFPLFCWGQTSFVQNIINTNGTLPTATYTCSNLTVPLSFNLHGSTINFTNTTGASLRVTANNVTIQNGTIVGLTGNFSSGQSAIQDNFANCSITGLVIKQFGQYAVSASSNSPTNINNLSITNNVISDIGNIAISVITNFGTVTGITVSGNTINRSMQPAPTVPNAAIIIRNFAPGTQNGTIVATNTITMPSNPSILAAEIIEFRGTPNAQFHDNICTGGTIGCSAIAGSNNFQCFNNTFTNQNLEALECGDLLNSNFHNNTITSGRIGMLFDGGSLCTLDTLQSTTMTGLTSYPIQFYQPAVHGITINSVVANTTTFAILVQQGAYGININNSTFTGNNTSYAIKFDNSVGQMNLLNDAFNMFLPKIIIVAASSPLTFNNVIGNGISPTGAFLSVQATANVTLGTNISFNAAPPKPIVAYVPNVYSFLINTAISPINITSSGGMVSSFSINTPQPSGLLWSTSTAQFSGTPLALTPLSSYVVTGSNASGSDTALIKIQIVDRAPVINYAPSSQVLTINVAMTPMVPNVSAGGAPTSFTVSPALPSNVTLNPVTGAITGTGISLLSPTVFTIFAFNSGGSTSYPVTLSIVNPAIVAPNIAYLPNTYSLPINTAFPSINPVNIGGPSSNWAISPALPASLNFSTTDGKITGLPTVLHTLSDFDISATNITGTSHTTLHLAIVATPPPAPNLSFTPNNVTLVQNQSAILITPNNAGGAVTAPYTITPSLISGLSFNTTTALISGTPSVTSPPVTYSVVGSNITGSSSAPITITVVAPNPPNAIFIHNRVGIIVY